MQSHLMGTHRVTVSIQRELVFIRTMLTQQHCNPAQIKLSIFVK